jgi:hypothetical protein
MFHFSPRAFVQLTVVGACCLAAAGQVQAQSILATTSTTSKSSNSNPAWHDTIPGKLISAKVRDGMFTIDGMVAKVKLNYNIASASYMYFFVPGMGTAVVSLSPMPGAVKVKNAFDGSKLTFTADGHSFELSNDGELVGKADAYVQFDRSTVALARTPRVGYGSTTQSPYVWPMSGQSAADKDAHLVQPPALPTNLLPRTMVAAPAPVPAAATPTPAVTAVPAAATEPSASATATPQ